MKKSGPMIRSPRAHASADFSRGGGDFQNWVLRNDRAQRRLISVRSVVQLHSGPLRERAAPVTSCTVAGASQCQARRAVSVRNSVRPPPASYGVSRLRKTLALAVPSLQVNGVAATSSHP